MSVVLAGTVCSAFLVGLLLGMKLRDAELLSSNEDVVSLLVERRRIQHENRILQRRILRMRRAAIRDVLERVNNEAEADAAMADWLSRYDPSIDTETA